MIIRVSSLNGTTNNDTVKIKKKHSSAMAEDFDQCKTIFTPDQSSVDRDECC